MLTAVIILFFVALNSCGTKKGMQLAGYVPPDVEMKKGGFRLIAKILDAENGQPVNDAYVRLSSSSFHGYTDSNGTIEFEHVPHGFITIVTQSEGYENIRKSLLVTDTTDVYTHRITLSKTDSELKIPDRSKLQDLVSGIEEKDRLDSQIDSLLVLRNEVVAQFEDLLHLRDSFTSTDRFFAPFRDLVITTDKDRCFPITWESGGLAEGKNGLPSMKLTREFSFTLINYDTGYLIDVTVERFKSEKDVLGTLFGGDYDLSFTELPTTNPKVKEEWISNRKELFIGSPQHFLQALADRRYISRGYRVYAGMESSQNESSYGSSFVFNSNIEVETSYFYGNDERGHYLDYPGQIKVENIRLYLSDRYDYGGLKEIQYETSWVKLEGGRLYFSDNGVPERRNALTFSGVWGFRTLCEMLPDEASLEF